MKAFYKILVVSFVVIIFLGFGFLWHYHNQEKHFYILQKENMELEKMLSMSQKELEVLKAELENIESPEAKEKMIREKLGMMKKDEIQYIIKKIDEQKQGE